MGVLNFKLCWYDLSYFWLNLLISCEYTLVSCCSSYRAVSRSIYILGAVSDEQQDADWQGEEDSGGSTADLLPELCEDSFTYLSSGTQLQMVGQV